MNIETELKKEYRNTDTWFFAFEMVIKAIVSSFGVWLMFVFMFSGPAIALVLYNVEWTPEGQEQFKSFLPHIMQVVGGCAGILVLAFNFPKKIYDVFWERASRRVEFYEKTDREFKQRMNDIEALLKKHNLIKDD